MPSDVLKQIMCDLARGRRRIFVSDRAETRAAQAYCYPKADRAVKNVAVTYFAALVAERHRVLLANDPDRLRDLPRAGDESFVAGVPLEFHANMEGPHRFAVM